MRVKSKEYDLLRQANECFSEQFSLFQNDKKYQTVEADSQLFTNQTPLSNQIWATLYTTDPS